MSDTTARIEARDVRKKFTLHQARATDLRERFMAWRKPKRPEALSELWALKGVSFSVEPGQALGIVGHNGSGKSTLLKMLTGILKPSSGSVTIRGRVGALIEVGAGFHPDLTGRENVFLNGSILGLSRQEIASKFDDIVAFANLERFIDTPVKRYSSGMYMRLGFAVAAHTDPDVLLIDEVLAVGDTFFQRKCIRHLKQFVARGGAVVFVSHAMSQVAETCETCLWLDHGEMRYHGPTEEAIDQYMALVAEREEEEFKRRHPEEWALREAERLRQEEEARIAREAEESSLLEASPEDREEIERHAVWLSDPNRARLTAIRLQDRDGRSTNRFTAGQPITVEIDYRFTRPLPNPAFCFEVYRQSDGLHMFTTSNYDHDIRWTDLPLVGTVRFHVPFMSLNAGEYFVRLRLYSDWRIGHWEEALEDDVPQAFVFSVQAGRFGHGCTYLPVQWQTPEGRTKDPVDTIDFAPEGLRKDLRQKLASQVS